MTGDKKQTPESSSNQKYESVVLDFLNKETSAIQRSQKPKESTEELNSLVSDLLKQVIKEAEQGPKPKVTTETMEELLSEFPQPDESPSIQQKGNSAAADRQPDKAAEALIAKKDDLTPSVTAAEKPSTSEKPVLQESQNKTASLFGANAAVKGKNKPLAIAIAAIVVIAAIAGFLFLRSDKKAPEQIAAQTAVATEATPSLPNAQPQTGTQTTAQPQNARAASAPMNTQPAAQPPAKNSDASQAKTAKAAAEAPAKSAAAVATTTPVQPKQEAQAAIPPAVQNQANITAAPEKPAVTVTPEPVKQAESVAEKKPAPIVASAPANVPVSAPASAPAAPAEQQRAPQAAQKNATSAVPITRANPQYPQMAMRTKATAVVTLDVTIDNQGKVTKAVPTSGPTMFHEEAVKAAMKWRYKPASIDGTNVPSQSQITFNFNLKK